MLASKTTISPRGLGAGLPAQRACAPRPLPKRAPTVCQAAQPSVDQPGAAPAAAPAPAPVQPQPYYVPPAPLAVGGAEVQASQSSLVGETTATTGPYPVYDPRVYQGAPIRQEYYSMPPPGYYPPLPPQTVQKEDTAGSGAPWWIFLGAGVVLGQVLAKVQEFMKNPKTPQQMMMEMAMKQMTGAMGGAPGSSPFGATPGASPFGGASPFPFPTPAAASPAVDTTATPVSASPSPSPSSAAASPAPSSGDSKPGGKFASRLSSEGREPVKAEAPKSTLDVVEPVVKEPSSSSSTSASTSSKKSAFSFADITDVTDSASTSSSNGGSAGTNNGSNEQAGVMSGMMEQMLRNPEMQKMLYPYLPEPMRNPQSIEWMLNNPEVKKQMEQMFASQNVMTPQMMEMMKSMDFNQDKVNRQFAELGLKPEDVISKVMANPELAAGFSNPKVQAAIIDISANPMNIMKYQEDPEVMKVLEKVTEIFQPNMPPGARK